VPKGAEQRHTTFENVLRKGKKTDQIIEIISGAILCLFPTIITLDYSFLECILVSDTINSANNSHLNLLNSVDI